MSPIKSNQYMPEERLQCLERKVEEMQKLLLPLFGKRRTNTLSKKKDAFNRQMQILIDKQSKRTENDIKTK